MTKLTNVAIHITTAIDGQFQPMMHLVNVDEPQRVLIDTILACSAILVQQGYGEACALNAAQVGTIMGSVRHFSEN